jgi:hypothetical protein
MSFQGRWKKSQGRCPHGSIAQNSANTIGYMKSTDTPQQTNQTYILNCCPTFLASSAITTPISLGMLICGESPGLLLLVFKPRFLWDFAVKYT